jgi:hypothetical protein
MSTFCHFFGKNNFKIGPRFGEFSTNGSLLTLGSYLKIIEVVLIFGLLFPMICLWTKMGWATFWEIFSQHTSGHNARGLNFPRKKWRFFKKKNTFVIILRRIL